MRNFFLFIVFLLYISIGLNIGLYLIQINMREESLHINLLIYIVVIGILNFMVFGKSKLTICLSTYICLYMLVNHINGDELNRIGFIILLTAGYYFFNILFYYKLLKKSN